MDRVTVYEDKNLRLEYVANGRYLHETWWGLTTYETFVRLMGEVSKALNTNHADGVLLDAREHKGISPDAQAYAAKTISEYAKKHGKFKEAIIVVKDIFSRFSVESYSKKVTEGSPVVVKFFDSVQSAEDWLRSS